MTNSSQAAGDEISLEFANVEDLKGPKYRRHREQLGIDLLHFLLRARHSEHAFEATLLFSSIIFTGTKRL